MPWNRIYYPDGALSEADKEKFAQGITDIYAEDYPKSSTLVAFFPFEPQGFFKGGQRTSKFFRVTLQHMRGSYSTKQLENVVRIKFRDVLKTFIEDRGMGYELQIEEIPPEEVSFDNYIGNTILGQPLLQEMIRDDALFPLKTVKA